jgi:NAD/NADP transhydrogenase beta subunit
MNESFTSFAYLIAAVLFILALRGLSHPTTSRRGNQLGIIGMVIAIFATFAHGGMSLGGGLLILLGIAIGGTIGLVAAQKIKMTALPQLVAAFHSLVGLAAVHRRAAQHSCREPDRDVDRLGHRRGHLHRLADRLRQAASADEGHAHHLPRSAQG